MHDYRQLQMALYFRSLDNLANILLNLFDLNLKYKQRTGKQQEKLMMLQKTISIYISLVEIII